MPDQNEMIAADAARYLNVSSERISALVRKQRLVGRIIASRVRVFTRAELDAYRAQTATNKGGRPRKTVQHHEREGTGVQSTVK